MGDIAFARHEDYDFRVPAKILKIKRTRKQFDLELAKVYFYHSDKEEYCRLNDLMKPDEGLREYVALATRIYEDYSDSTFLDALNLAKQDLDSRESEKK